MTTCGPDQHVFIALGTPWLDAAVAFLEPEADVNPWSVHGDMAAGDILITLLDTEPQTVLCVETLTAPFSDGMARVEVDSFSLPLVLHIEKRLAIAFPVETGQIDDAMGDEILQSLESDRYSPFGEFDALDPTSTAAHARTLMEDRGRCTACYEPLQLKKYRSGDIVHFHSATRVFRLHQLCRIHGHEKPAVPGRQGQSHCQMFPRNACLPLRSPSLDIQYRLCRRSGHPEMALPRLQPVVGADVHVPRIQRGHLAPRLAAQRQI
ncbi:hypothetical protein [Rhodococcus sp. IEGM 1379]|uniref:hypothetical protein n=1 Tax=Rhodococcus sp. IEGM 1379 TaxID=3047086 RepID=UPI0024B7BE4F|nr:hypothetical protein [Rhodococcus sp. IEGM 1379]MDI9916333.1 hypothetical protein [Rhodococcus sp. IEGM 1379]